MRPLPELALEIHNALESATGEATRLPDGAWSAQAANGTLVSIRARVVDDDWLVVTASHPGKEDAAAKDRWWPLLGINAALTGPTRLVRLPTGDVALRAETFIGDWRSRAGALIERVTALCDDVVAVAHRPLDASGGWPDAEDFDAASAGTDQIADLCVEAGWRAVRNASGDVLVPLETRTATVQARLGLSPAHHLRAELPLESSAALVDVSRQAIALLLLDAGASIRTIKGVTLARDDLRVPGLAAAGERLPISPAIVERTLAALSVGCDVVGREVAALHDPELARAYLAMRLVRTSPAQTKQLEETSCLQLP